MKIIKVEAVYRCSYCNKLYQMKHACEKHEAGCWGNPKNRAMCFSCKHYVAPYTEINDCDEIEFHSHHCSLKNKYMLSGKQIAKGQFIEEYCDKDKEWKQVQEKLPTECDTYTHCDDSNYPL